MILQINEKVIPFRQSLLISCVIIIAASAAAYLKLSDTSEQVQPTPAYMDALGVITGMLEERDID